MNSKKIDQLLVSIGLALIFVSAYQLFIWRTNQESEGLSLGFIKQTTSVVKIKNSSGLDWRDGASGDLLGDKQLIYTDNKSSASIKLISGNEVSVSENSLIKISALRDVNRLDIKRGFIRAKLKYNKPLIINANGTELKINSHDADVQISVQGEEINLGVVRGEVAVEHESQIQKINKSKSLKIQNGNMNVEESSIKIIEPSPGMTLYSLNERAPVVFKWEPLDSYAEVLVADNPSLKKATVYRGNGTATAHLGVGSYFWKVENSHGTSMLGAFRILNETIPELIRPLTGEMLTLPYEGLKAPEIFLQWKGSPDGSYLVEWTDGELHQKVVKGAGILIPVTKSGVLNWRVKISSPERALALWSESQSVDLTVVPLPIVPENLMPKHRELQTYSKEDVAINLSWTSNSPAELEVINPLNERFIQNVEDTNFQYNISMSGDYKWRVRGRDQFSRSSHWSSWETFTLLDLSEDVHKEGHQKFILKRPDQLVTFNWEGDEGKSSTFELSATETFSEVIIKKKVTGKEVSIVIPHVGDYYWRSRQKSKDGTIKYSAPKKVIIEAAPAPEKPMKLPDIEVPLKWEETNNKPESGWLDFFIARAYAEEFRSVAKITLPPNEDAKSFVIKIFNDSQRSDLVLEQTINSNVLTWTGAKPGQYFWQYAIVDHWGRQSPFSDLSAITVTGSKPLPPVKPDLRSPAKGERVQKAIKFSWSRSKNNKSYKLEVASDLEFKKIFLVRSLKSSSFLNLKKEFPPGDYYWRVTAFGESKKELVSDTAHFVKEQEAAKPTPPLEKITIVDMPAQGEKKFSKRISIAWAPSRDNFEFEGENREGEINGNTMNSFEAKGIYFTNAFIFSGNILRQSGEVFGNESYSFTRALLQGSWKLKKNNHLWGPGLSAGFVSGHTYTIKDSQVSDSEIDGIIYGPHIEGFYNLSSLWEIHGKARYMLGAIPHTELTIETKREMKIFYLLMGIGAARRIYKAPAGSLSSLRLSLGLGKEF